MLVLLFIAEMNQILLVISCECLFAFKSIKHFLLLTEEIRNPWNTLLLCLRQASLLHDLGPFLELFTQLSASCGLDLAAFGALLAYLGH